MSVLVTMKFPGDTETFKRSLDEREADYEKFAGQSQAAGALHHRFGVGNGFVLVVDEWETEEAFNAFLARPDLQQFIGEVGADTTQPPEITITEATPSPDEY